MAGIRGHRVWMGSKLGLEWKRKRRFWRWLALALGEAGHTGARQFGEGEDAAVEDGGGERGQASWGVRWRAFEEGCG